MSRASSGPPSGSTQTHHVASERMRLISCALRGPRCWLWAACAHFFSQHRPPPLPGGRGDYDAYFTDEAAEAHRGEGITTQPVVAEPGLEPRGVVTLKTKFSPTLQAAVLIEESRGGMSVCLSVCVCVSMYTWACVYGNGSEST